MSDLPRFTVTIDPDTFVRHTRLDDYELPLAHDIKATINQDGQTMVTFTIPVRSAKIEAWPLFPFETSHSTNVVGVREPLCFGDMPDTPEDPDA